MKEWIHRLFKAIDKMNAEEFISFLTPDASFRFANAAAVEKKSNIRETVTEFFSSLKSMRHNLLGVWEDKETVICEGEVTYARHDLREFTFPFVNIFRMEGKLIADYRIFIDSSQLFSQSA